MPFVEGESLGDRLRRETQLPVADAVRMASEVASALDYAHRHGVVHRDVKPENILLHDRQALVVDFGIALAASRAGGTRMTETALSLGTPQYMSPEVPSLRHTRPGVPEAVNDAVHRAMALTPADRFDGAWVEVRGMWNSTLSAEHAR